MSLSRRRFVQTLSAGAARLYVAGRGREAGLFDLARRAYAPDSIGTMDEMKRAAAVFQEVLALPPSAARLEPMRREFRRRDARDWAC